MGIDNWGSKFGTADLELLCELGNEHHFDPCIPAEMEDYFVGLLQEARQSDEDIEQWLRRRIQQDFKCVADAPDWIQGQEWQISNGKPMIFVGQLNVPQNAHIFHDESSFYIFLDANSRETKVVTQIS